MIDPSPAPKFLFVQINVSCNLHCQHCFYWTQKEPPDHARISVGRICELIGEFADLSPRGSVVICGGESLLAEADYLQVCSTCRASGLRSLSVTNGTTITTEVIARRILENGPDELTVSLDSHLEHVHDQARGTKGSYRAAVQALNLMVAARKISNLPERRINAMTLIYDDNYLDLDSLYHLVLDDIGADKLKINLLQPSFGLGEYDSFFVHHHQVDGAHLATQLTACSRKYNLNLNPVWIHQVEMYFNSLNASSFAIPDDWYFRNSTSEHICNSGERNIMVDLNGIARLCFSNRFTGSMLMKPGDMKAFWESSDPIRKDMVKCNALCGISHSVRRENGSLKTR